MSDNSRKFNLSIQSKVLSFLKGDDIDTLNDFLADRSISSYEDVNAISHGYLSAKTAYDQGMYRALVEGMLKEQFSKMGGFLDRDYDGFEVNVRDTVVDIYNDLVGLAIGGLAKSWGLSWNKTEDLLAEALKNGAFLNKDDPQITAHIMNILTGTEEVQIADLLDIAREIMYDGGEKTQEQVLEAIINSATNNQSGVYQSSDGSYHPYSYVDGAIGDNAPGDGYAYDYTLDLSDAYNEWSNDVVTNENGETSPHPPSRPDDLNSDSGGSSASAKPLIVDLGGDGPSVLVGAEVSFDFDDDGFKERTSWVAPNDGFLVIDLQEDGSRTANSDGTFGDGNIDQAKEIAFALWGADGMTDLQALAEAVDNNGNKIFDSNDDGVLNSSDNVWGELRIWQDANSNGVVDGDELMTLDQVDVLQRDIDGVVTTTLTGITEIDLAYEDGTDFADMTNDISVFGNRLHGSANFVAGTGVTITGGVGDVSLSYNELGWKLVDTATGYYIEFENGDRYDYAVQDGTGSADIDLNTLWLDGATGDVRNNVLTAAGSSKSVAISGLEGNDNVQGGANDDMLSGDEGADTVSGNAGNDLLFVDSADISISGGSGYDTVIAVEYDGVTVTGINLNMLTSTVEAAYGNSGNDILNATGTQYDVALYGGAGNDTLTGGSTGDILSGDDGNDNLASGAGDDFVSGGDGDDFIAASSGDDFVMGGAGSDTIYSSSQDDFVLAGDGDDKVFGGTGDDYVAGGDGTDILDGGSEDDSLFGGEGNDTLTGGAGDDHLDGGEGDDLFDMDADGTTHSYDVVQGGIGNDTIKLFGLSSDWTWVSSQTVVTTSYWVDENTPAPQQIFVSTTKGINQWKLTNGNAIIDIQDVETLEFSDGSTVMLTGGDTATENADTYYRAGTGATASTMYSHLNYFATSGDDTVVDSVTTTNQYTGTETTNYATGNDTFEGFAGDDAISSGWGNDLVNGGSGSDVLSGNTGNDTLEGDSGADAIFGGAGNDNLIGNGGADRIDGGDNDDLIYGYSGGDVLTGGTGLDTIYGGSGADLIGGQDGNDILQGNAGDDQLYGGDGNDDLNGGMDNDRLYGGAGDNTLTGEYGDDVLIGGDGIDTLYGDHGFDLLYGNEGADKLFGGDFDDVAYGGDGDDSLYGQDGNDVLEGGAGADIINGGAGIIDTSSYTASNAAVTVSLVAGTGLGGHAEGDTLVAVENLLGSRFSDSLTGNSVSNSLAGAFGNDVLSGEAGHDFLFGGAGQDTATGGDGIDRLYGGSDSDDLDGGNGDDQLFGGDDGTDLNTAALSITNGDFAAPTLADGIYGGTSSVTDWTVSGVVGAFNPTSTHFTGGTVPGGDDNVVQINAGGFIEQEISSGIADDERFTIGVDVGTYLTWADTLGYTLELLIGGEVVKTQTRESGFEEDQWETAYITLDGDTLSTDQIGQSITLRITAPAGHHLVIDSVRQIFDDDVLKGAAGDDELYGGAGDDVLIGGTGADALDGGLGLDTASYAGAAAGVLANLVTPANNTGDAYGDSFVGVENLTGTDWSDTLVGNDSDNTLTGGLGDDILYGGAGSISGNDVLIGGAGADSLVGGLGTDTASYEVASIVDLQYTAANTGNAVGDTYVSIENLSGSSSNDGLRGDAGNNRIDGNAGNDGLHGRDGDDILNGGSGTDWLYGGTGSDTLTGGDGVDTFVFQASNGVDVITDYEDGVDQIDVQGLGLTWAGVGTDWHIFANSGDAKIVFVAGHNVTLDGVDSANLTASDFIF